MIISGVSKLSDAAIANLVTGLVTITTIVIGFLTMWLKLKYNAGKAEELAKKTDTVERKIDINTTITKAATAEASRSAEAAATTAAEAKVATESMAESINKKLNGGVDIAIESAIKPIRDALTDHVAQYEMDIRNIRNALEDLRKRLK